MSEEDRVEITGPVRKRRTKDQVAAIDLLSELQQGQFYAFFLRLRVTMYLNPKTGDLEPISIIIDEKH